MESTPYEDIRKLVRKLENELDVKLIALSKLCSNRTSSKPREDLDDDEGFTQVVERTSAEIESLLHKLEVTNDALVSSVSERDSVSIVVPHILQRHREVLQGFRNELSKTTRNYYWRKQEGIQGPLENENRQIRSSERLVDSQISIAVDTREQLISQRLHLKRIRDRMGAVKSRFPVLNSWIQRADCRKRRDSLALGAIVAVLTFVFLAYKIV